MRTEKKFLLFYFWGLFFSLLYYISCSNVQNIPPPLRESEVKKIIEKDYGNRNPTVSLKKGVLALQVRTNADEAGQFTIGISDSAGKITPLLYNNPRGPWSYVNVFVGRLIYSNSENIYSHPQNKLLILDKEPHVNSDGTAISCTWKIGDIKVEQRLTPRLRGNRNEEVLIQYTISNEGDKDHEVGLLLQMDTMVNKNDAAPISSSFGYCQRDTHFTKLNMPLFFQASDSRTPFLNGHGILILENKAQPDSMIVGNWWDLREMSWGDTPKNGIERHSYDSAVILRWHVDTLSAGAKREIVTSYGSSDILWIPPRHSIPDRIKIAIEAKLDTIFTFNRSIDKFFQSDGQVVELDFADIMIDYVSIGSPFEFFPDAFYKPNVDENFQDLIDWTVLNNIDSVKYNFDDIKPPILSYILDRVAVKIVEYINQETRDDPSSTFTLLFEGTADSRGFKRSIKVLSKDITPCRIMTYDKNQALKCLRTYYALKELKSRFYSEDLKQIEFKSSTSEDTKGYSGKKEREDYKFSRRAIIKLIKN